MGFNLSNLRCGTPRVVFTTDSTLTGCGGLTDSEFFHVAFPPSILSRNFDINAFEILGIVIAERLWGAAGKNILVYCDNSQLWLQ